MEILDRRKNCDHGFYPFTPPLTLTLARTIAPTATVTLQLFDGNCGLSIVSDTAACNCHSPHCRRFSLPLLAAGRSQDERSLLRHARSLERNACRFERERLREVEREEAKGEVQLIKTTVRVKMLF